MIYIVSGMMRSGTTCMMRALEAGGMTVASSPERDQMAAVHADEHYQPNPDSKLYEVPLKEYGNVDFPLAYQGKVIKVMLWGLDSLAVNPDGYRVVIMRRDPEEIRQSYEAFFGHPLRHPWMTEYEQRIERAHAMLANRLDVLCVDTIHYHSVINNPDQIFDSLRRRNCWKINSEAAAATIDPDLYRFRRERLTVGI